MRKPTILFATLLLASSLFAADNLKWLSNSIIDICNAPEFSYKQRIDIAAERYMQLITDAKKSGDEGDTELLVKAYEAFAELFNSYDALAQRDAWNRKFLAKLNVKSPLDFNIYLYMVGSYMESSEEDVYKAVTSFKYQGDATLGLKFLSDIPTPVAKLDKYDQARYYAMQGTLLVFGGKYDDAVKAFAKASELVKVEFGNTSPEHLYFRMFEELPYSAKGDFKKALSVASKTEEDLRKTKLNLSYIGKTIRGTDFVEYSSLLNRMASYSRMLGDSKKELKYNEQALEAAYDNFGSDNRMLKPYQALSLPVSGPQVFLDRTVFDIKEQVANSYYLIGKKKESLEMYKELISDYKRDANSASGYSTLNIAKVKAMMEPLTIIAPLCASRFPEDKEIQELAYDCTLQYKNFSLYAENLVQKMVQLDKSKDVKDIYAKIQNIKKKITKNPEEEIDYRDELNQLNDQLLVELDFSTYGNLMNVSWKDVQSALTKTSAAIEFLEYIKPDGKKAYLASILKNTGVPYTIKICDDDFIANIKDAYKSPEAYEAIWGPVLAELKGVKKIYFSPTGRFYDIGIEYLQDKQGGILNQKLDMYRLSSTRELAEARKAAIDKHSVIYGGIIYNPNGDKSNASNSRGGLNYLPQTLEEAKNVEKTLKTSSKVKTFTDKAATEESFKLLSGSPIGVLHVATHGFYWTERNAKRMKMPFLVKGKNRTAEDKAMSRSGLFFANANNVLTGGSIEKNKEDGVLTSSEIAQLNLQDVDLVVLSACQTALGETNSDGVFGLQRGFKKAGARTLVMSLWKVDDEATQILMSDFYKQIASGKPLHEAFVSAQKHLRESQNGKFSDPYYWAAFVMLDAV